MSWIRNEPLRRVVFWQTLATGLATLVCGWLMGMHGAISALLGGLVSIAASLAYAVLIDRHGGYTAGDVVKTALKAEAIKISIMIVLLLGVFLLYKEVVPIVFIGVFIVAAIIFSMALFVTTAKNK
ncbi:MAG TPA: ATP synthase subunit I [Nitrosomonas sp.]|nr:ATP synthase subunit I [Nitrosomonas sp.]HMW19597.1 ATP synthase subunit I [Nitrosomonas sp.]HMW68098.1 ATP synthase subunit I [Nitrosomonas sp.]HMY61549.1 ATP synthase subunit I [Nitrosomonas sp.]HMY90214.1 ATP synthase subunit I [Nitrosomonas sp.]